MLSKSKVKPCEGFNNPFQASINYSLFILNYSLRKVSFSSFIPAIASCACFGLPRLHVGSPGSCRHGGRMLELRASCGQQYQRRRLLVSCEQRQSAQQWEPGLRRSRALRPASAAAFYLFSERGDFDRTRRQQKIGGKTTIWKPGL